VASLAYTSPSHTEDAPRWRVLCLFSKEYPPDRRDAFMGRLNGLFRGIFSAESWTLSQSFYLGSVNNNPSHRAEIINGTPIDLLPALDETWIGRRGATTGTDDEQGKARPIGSSSAYAPVSSVRLEGYRNTVLDTLRRDAVDGQKHVRLRAAARTLGGIQAEAGFSDADAVQWLMDALPDTVEDWILAASTAAWALAKGREKPIWLEDRPRDTRKRNGAAATNGANGGSNGADHAHAASSSGDAHQANGANGADHQAARDDEAIQVRPGQLHTLATAGEAALIKAGLQIYQRGLSLVQPVTVEVSASDGRVTFASALGELNLPVMLDKLSQAATWERWDARRKLPLACDPPRTVADIILSRAGNWKVPRIAGVITSPTLRPDGTVLQAAGYDPATRLYHVADPAIGRLNMPRRPTRADAERGLGQLDDLLDEFPFCTKVDKSVGLSAMVTPVVRGAMSVSPMHGFSAPAPGSGKSYLADVAAAIATGRDCCPAITFADKADEGEKRLTGMLLAGFPLLSLDNVNGELGGDLLCQAIERRLIRLRALGGSTITEIENRACIFANGNNVTVRADVVRRTLVAKLDAKMERPEERTFDGKPVEKVLANRGVYIAACLTIVRAYLVAGSPDKLPPLASFGDWSNLVRSALVWLGCADPCDSIKEARRDDPELSELLEFLSLWKANLGIDSRYTARAVVEAAEVRLSDDYGNPTVSYRLPDLHDVLLRIAGDRGAIDTRRFGKWLERLNGRIAGGLRLSRDSVRGHGGVSVWIVAAP